MFRWEIHIPFNEINDSLRVIIAVPKAQNQIAAAGNQYDLHIWPRGHYSLSPIKFPRSFDAFRIAAIANNERPCFCPRAFTEQINRSDSPEVSQVRT